MLVVTRLRNQSIMIGDDIEVKITNIGTDKVRVGIKAPKSLSVHRKEIYDTIRRENMAAIQAAIEKPK